MRIEAAARRYAQAAFSVALEQGEPESWLADLDVMAGFMSRPEAAAILQSDRVPGAEKTALLETALSGGVPAVLNLARLLVAKRRVRLTAQIHEEFRNLLEVYRGRASATVTTAVPLTNEQKNEVGAKLSRITGKQVSVEPVVDPNILGGLIARIGDTLIDGSTRSRLIALKKSLRAAG